MKKASVYSKSTNQISKDEALSSSKPKEGDTSLDEIRGNLGIDRGATLFSEVQGSSEQRTESYYTYDEGVVAGDNTEIHKKSAPKSNGEVSKVDRQDSTPKEGEVIFDELQGRIEQRTESYYTYDEGVVTDSNAVDRKKNEPKVIFFGNGLLSSHTLQILEKHFNIIFHAQTTEDLKKIPEIKTKHPEAIGILASFGVMVKPEILQLFEPIGILNLHPSLLPAYRGASPIESAILAGDKDFSYSIMKLVKKMDAGPIYHQATLKNLPIDKTAIYQALATAGATWICENITEILDKTIKPQPQDNTKATFTTKFDKSMSYLEPEKYTASELFRQIVAYQNFPKPKYEFFGKTCIILKAHTLRVTDILCEAADIAENSSPLMIKCKDRNFVVVDELQPEGKKPMDARSFVNGYGKKR